jgi:AraC family transcriptional regulator
MVHSALSEVRNERLSNSIHEYTRRIDRVIDYLRDHLDKPLKLEDLAKVACFSEYHFHRVFRAMTGETLHDFTNRLRLEKAVRLLKRTRQSVTERALECGFSSSTAFSRSFKKHMALPPPATESPANSKIARFAKNYSQNTNIFFP